MISQMPCQDGILECEAKTFAQYLLDREPPADLIARYVIATRTLFPSTPEPSEQAIIDFVRRHEWALPFIDAAAGLLQPRSLLRRKILLLAAVLEASPRFVDDFLPRPSSPIACIVKLVTFGVVAVCKLAIGGLLLALLRRSSG
jgi:hypothetical protein